MRREDRKIEDPEQLRRFLAKQSVLHLAMTDGQTPYVVPMNYGVEWTQEGLPVFYLHCAGDGLRLSLLRKNPRVCVEISLQDRLLRAPTPCAWSCRYFSIVAFGTAQIQTEPEEKAHALRALLRQNGFEGEANFPPEMLSRVTTLRILASSVTAKSNRRAGEEEEV